MYHTYNGRVTASNDWGHSSVNTLHWMIGNICSKVRDTEIPVPKLYNNINCFDSHWNLNE